MKSDPDADGPVGMARLDSARGRRRIVCVRERGEELLAPCVDDLARIGRDHVPNDLPMLAQYIRVRFAEARQEFGRALHVREEERDRSSRKGPHPFECTAEQSK
jgi:hypothetical protein